jgi:hypothetical protein
LHIGDKHVNRENTVEQREHPREHRIQES